MYVKLLGSALLLVKLIQASSISGSVLSCPVPLFGMVQYSKIPCVWEMVWVVVVVLQMDHLNNRRHRHQRGHRSYRQVKNKQGRRKRRSINFKTVVLKDRDNLFGFVFLRERPFMCSCDGTVLWKVLNLLKNQRHFNFCLN